MAALSDLKAKDELILNAIFNPHTPLDIQDEVASGKNIQSENLVTDDLKELEIKAVKSAQKGEFDKSLDTFNEVICKAPNYASGYNNRAQLFRIQGNLF